MKPSEILRCPSCSAKLQGGEDKGALLWLCTVCFGAGLRTELLREKAPAYVIKALWKAAKEQSGPSERNCLLCEQRMVLVSQPLPSGQVLHLDACRRCSLVWFDANELNDLLTHGPLADSRAKDSALQLHRELRRTESAIERAPADHPIATQIAGELLINVFFEVLSSAFN